jgi:peptide/nickel transport system permease protein
MITDATQYLELNPLQVLLPSLGLVSIVLAVSFVGDGLRDAFDPESTS